MLRLILLSSVIFLVLPLGADPLGTSVEPFEPEDQITVEEVLRRYPYLRPHMNPEILYQLVMQIPEGLRSRLHMVTVEVKGGKGSFHCYNPCVKADVLTAFL